MKKAIKKGIAALMAVSVLGTALTGCGDQKPEGQTAKDASAFKADDEKEYTIS